jgi:hypothetical protein
MLAALTLTVFQHAGHRKLIVVGNTYVHSLLPNMNVGISQVFSVSACLNLVILVLLLSMSEARKSRGTNR